MSGDARGPASDVHKGPVVSGDAKELAEVEVSPLPSPWVSWSETAVLSCALPLLGVWLRPQDPLFLAAGFFWPALGCALAGLRYGAIHGLCAAALLDFLLAWAMHAHSIDAGGFPVQPALAAVLLGLICGEFCDAGQRQASRIRARSEQRRIRLLRFSRVYHALRASHDRLERKLAGTQSLRHALAELAGVLSRSSARERGEKILQILAEHASISAASLHLLDARGKPQPAFASLGEGEAASPGEPLLAEALSRGELVTVAAEEEAEGGLLAAMPLIDAAGAVHGVLAVREMQFLAFNQDNLQLLAVLGGHLADLFSESPAPGVSPSFAFQQEVARSIADHKRFGLPATLVTLSPRGEAAEAAAGRALLERRALDRALAIPGGVVMLLPVSGVEEAELCVERLRRSLSPEDEGALQAQIRPITAQDDAATLLAEQNEPLRREVTHALGARL